MFEKRFAAIPPQPLTTDGTSAGRATFSSPPPFKVKQHVVLQANTLPDLILEVKEVHSPNIVYFGPVGGSIKARVDISAYTVALGATVYAEEQQRTKVPEQEIERHTYEEEPTVARRTALVDPLGKLISEANPLPVTTDAHPDGFERHGAGTITSPAFEVIFTYTSLDNNTKIAYVEATVSTAATIRVLVDGEIIRELRTSSLERNASFRFYEYKRLLNGQVLTVEAQVDRMIHSDYQTFTALEGHVA